MTQKKIVVNYLPGTYKVKLADVSRSTKTIAEAVKSDKTLMSSVVSLSDSKCY